jgi:cobaltochelatase CobS
MQKTIKVEKVELEMADGKNKYVPKNGGNFIDHGNILKTLAIAIRDNLPTLLTGESGTGKTSAIRYLAAKTQNGLRRINLNGGTTADELVGRLLINDKGTYWVDGILTEAMRNGEWIVFDEINAALPEVLFVLQSVMDDDGYLVLTEKDDKELVIKHENFRIFATCNPPEYAGTKEMNKALLSRFVICINAEFPPKNKEMDIIKSHLGQKIAQSEMANKLVELANETRLEKEKGSVDYAINTRDILNVLRLCENMNPMEALSLAFSNKLESADNKALKMLAKLHLPLTKKGASEQREKITTVEQLIIGKTYTVDVDTQNTYIAITTDKEKFEEIIKKDLGEVIKLGIENKENAIKGDKFIIEGIYYENMENGISKTEITNMGVKVASAISIVEGQNKEKKAIIIHHPELGTSMDIISNLVEIK